MFTSQNNFVQTAPAYHEMCVNLKLKGGSVLRLFHKELEAYLVAEGLFEEQLTEEGILAV